MIVSFSCQCDELNFVDLIKEQDKQSSRHSNATMGPRQLPGIGKKLVDGI